MFLLLDCLLDLVSKAKFYEFKIIFVYDLLPLVLMSPVFMWITIMAESDDGGIDKEELDSRLDAALDWRTVMIPVTYSPNYYYIALPSLALFILWLGWVPPLKEEKPNTVYQMEYLPLENSAFGGHTIFFLYFSIITVMAFYRWSEEDVYPWDRSRQWPRHYGLYRPQHQNCDFFLCLLFLGYPIYYVTYPLVEHPHTAYLFYFILLFWSPFYSYYSYLEENFEIMQADISPNGMLSDFMKQARVSRFHRRWADKFFIHVPEKLTWKLSKGMTFKEWKSQMNLDEDDITPVYDPADFLTLPRYIILLVMTVPVAFLLLFFS